MRGAASDSVMRCKMGMRSKNCVSHQVPIPHDKRWCWTAAINGWSPRWWRILGRKRLRSSKRRLTLKKTEQLNDSLAEKDPPTLIILHNSEGHDREAVTIVQANGSHKICGRCFYFIRMTTKAVEIKSVETDLAFGEICSSAIEGFHELLAIVYKPDHQLGFQLVTLVFLQLN